MDRDRLGSTAEGLRREDVQIETWSANATLLSRISLVLSSSGFYINHAFSHSIFHITLSYLYGLVKHDVLGAAYVCF